MRSIITDLITQPISVVDYCLKPIIDLRVSRVDYALIRLFVFFLAGSPLPTSFHFGASFVMMSLDLQRTSRPTHSSSSKCLNYVFVSKSSTFPLSILISYFSVQSFFFDPNTRPTAFVSRTTGLFFSSRSATFHTHAYVYPCPSKTILHNHFPDFSDNYSNLVVGLWRKTTPVYTASIS